MLSSLNKYINKSDIAYRDYTSNSERNKIFKPLIELFCDNNNNFTPIENRYPSKLNGINGEEIEISNIPKELLGRTVANIKFAFNHIGLQLNEQGIKRTGFKLLLIKTALTKLVTLFKCRIRFKSLTNW